MAIRVPSATGNWSSTTNWLTETASSFGVSGFTLGTTNNYSFTFTAPNTTAKCLGVVLNVTGRTASSNITIALQENGVDVVSQTFTSSALPLNATGMHFFRFSTPYTYTTTTPNAYRFRATISTGTSTNVMNSTNSSFFGGVAVDDRTSAIAATDEAYIAADVGGSAKVITFDKNDATTSCLSVHVGYNATLQFSTTMSTQMVIGNGTATSLLGSVYPGGTWTIGTLANPIPAAYTANLLLDGNSTATSATAFNHIQVASGQSGFAAGMLSLVGDPTYNSRAKSVEGYDTGWYATVLASNAAVGATTMVLRDDLGLRAGGGDVLTISECNSGPTFNVSNHEYRTTTAYNAATKTVTFSPGLTVAHDAGAIVNNVTRNVSVKAVSTARFANILTTGANTVAVSPMVIRHALFETIGRIANQGQNSHYTPLGFIDIVGCAFSNPANVTNYGIYQLWSGRVINCHFARVSVLNSTSPLTAADVVRHLEVIECSTTYSSPMIAANGVLVRDCLICAFYWAQNAVYVRFQNCTGADAAWMQLTCTGCEFIDCTVNSLTALTSSGVGCVYDGVRVTGFSTYVLDGAPIDTVIRNCVFANAPSTRVLNVAGVLGQFSAIYRAAFIQNSIIPTYPSTFTQQYGGQTRRYTSGTVPQAVFPTPSGAQVANRLEQMTAVAQTWPMTLIYRIPVPTGAQSNTVRVSVWLNGWGTNLPTANDLYLELLSPGAGDPIVSTTTVSANDQWTTLTATATSTGQGYIIARVVLKKYVANATCYVDFPLDMEPTGYDWWDGRPNEYMLNRVPTAHLAGATLSAVSGGTAEGAVVLAAGALLGASSGGMADGGLTIAGAAALSAQAGGAAAAGLVLPALVAMSATSGGAAEAALQHGAAAALSGQSGGTAAAELLVPYLPPGRPGPFAAPSRPTTFTVPTRRGTDFDPPGQG